MTPTTVFAAASVTALATGLGALPLLFVRRFRAEHLGFANALAAGLMIAASLGLLLEGLPHGFGRLAIGAGAGALFVHLSSRWMGEGDHLHWGQLRGADARRALLLVGVMFIHSVTEGVALGVAMGSGQEELGLLVTIVLAIHNLPEGLAIAVALVPKGVSVLRSALWGVFSSLPQPLLAVPAFLAVAAFAPLLGLGLGFAAGAMIWMSCTELLPEAAVDTSRRAVASALAVGFLLMMSITLALQAF
jgi:zinc transporter, ZIP family